jgi:hypothetical protein
MKSLFSAKDKGHGAALSYLYIFIGSQAASRWLSTSAAQVSTRVGSCGICGGQNCKGANLLRVLQFSLAIIALKAEHLSSFIIIPR